MANGFKVDSTSVVIHGGLQTKPNWKLKIKLQLI